MTAPSSSGRSDRHHVVIVGGGISGLAAAHRLTEDADPPRITLLEASPRFGGWIRTGRIDGWIVEDGPDLFLGSKPGAWELCERLGLAGRLHGTSPRARGAYVSRAGRLYRIPDGLTGLVPTRAAPFLRSPLLSPTAKLRVALEPLVPRRKDDEDESVESFVVRRLGREMYDRLVEPLLSGIYAGDGSQLGILATFPQFRESERAHGGLVRAMLRARRPAATRGFVSLPTGMQELPEALVARLRARGAELRAGAGVTDVGRAGDGWTVRLADGSALSCTHLIVATPAPAAARLLDAHAPDAAAALREIPHASTITVSLGHRAADVPRPLDATGYLVPRVERRPALACTWASAKFDGRAPEGHVLFRVFLGGAARPPVAGLDDDAAIGLARAELAEQLGVRGEPVLVRVARQSNAMPQYLVGHRERVARVRRAIAGIPSLALLGNALDGVGIPDCVRGAESAAARLLTSFRSPAPPFPDSP